MKIADNIFNRSRLFAAFALTALALLMLWTMPANAQTQAKATISWTDVTDEDTYEVERADAGGAFIQIGQVVFDITSFNDVGPLPLGVQYCYRVIATNVFGSAAPSAAACGTPLVPGQVIGVQVILSPAL